jgi:outer membrane receptor protein involved in Fe transport
MRGPNSSALLPILLASTVLAGFPAMAMAQAQQGQLEVVVVTAQKQSQNLQKVPMNVQAMTTETLTQLHLTDFNDFEKYMPSVTFAVSGQGSNGGPGFANITMRGVASDQNGNHSGPLPTVGVYLDEAPITTIGGTLDVPTYDVQRVEALSGPQGTLYGASSESGTIRIITNQPDTDALYGSITTNVNSVDHGGIGYGANGFVNIPLSDKMAVRLVGWGEHDAGYIDNVHNVRTYYSSGITIDNGGPGTTLTTTNRIKSNYNTVDKYGARAALRIDLDDNWTVTPMVMAQTEKSNGFFGYDPHIGDLKVGHFTPEYVKDNWYQAALTVQGKIANLDVIYAGSYMNRTVESAADYSDYAFWYDQPGISYGLYFYDNLGNLVDPTQYILGKDLFTKQSHELRISTPKDNRFRVVGGLFYERQSHHILQDYTVVGNIADSITVPGWPHTIWLTDQLRVDRDYAAFAQADYDLTPNLTLTAGIRGFYADNSLQGFFGFAAGFSSHTGVAACFNPTPIVPGGPCTDLNARVHESGETHKIGLTVHVSDSKLVYLTYSTGFRPGGVNRRNDIPGVGPYSSDTLDNYEIGWKTSWDENRLRFNGDIYLENWNKFQFPFLGPNSVTIIKNVGQAQIKGMEAQLTWLPIDSLTLTGNVAYNDAQLAADYCGGNCATNAVQSPPGTQLPITPKWKLNAIARYEFQLAGLNAHIQGAMVHQSGTWPDLRLYQRSLLGQSKAYTMFDFAAGVGLNDWLLELSVQNAFDERAQLGRFAACTPETCGFQTYILPSQPRTIGLTFTQKFGND